MGFHTINCNLQHHQKMKLGSPKYSSHSRTFCKHFILCRVLINKLETNL